MAGRLRPSDPHLHVSASPADGELARLVERVANSRPVERLEGLRRLLDGLHGRRGWVAGGERRTLDLLAHARPDRLLQLGTSVLDPRDADVRRLFRELARDEILPALGIHELRLLGCETAMSRAGQAAIRALTDILGLRVVGTTRPVYAAHFGAAGLHARFEAMLCDADSLPDLPSVEVTARGRAARRGCNAARART